WSKTSILPDSRGNTAIFVHYLVKNIDSARFPGQYRDFCPLPVISSTDILNFRESISKSSYFERFPTANMSFTSMTTASLSYV
ncbi:MAG: hypothetical protein QM296_10695, partial [Bacillota bacterium]|nr:hypothetical protein [Bacillota bacterium]